MPKAGFKHSEESIERMRACKVGANNPNFGRVRTEESKLKTSISLKGHSVPPEVRQKISKRISESLPQYQHKLKDAWADPIKRKARLEIMNSAEYRQKIGAHSKLMWKDPDFKKSLSGENSSQWNGGSSFEPYCPKFNEEFKERVRAFFNYTCQMCDTVWKHGDRKLSVHHVNYNKQTCCDSESEPLFVPLCQRCHAKTNSSNIESRKRHEHLFSGIITTIHGGKCYLTKDEYGEISNVS